MIFCEFVGFLCLLEQGSEVPMWVCRYATILGNYPFPRGRGMPEWQANAVVVSELWSACRVGRCALLLNGVRRQLPDLPGAAGLS